MWFPDPLHYGFCCLPVFWVEWSHLSHKNISKKAVMSQSHCTAASSCLLLFALVSLHGPADALLIFSTLEEKKWGIFGGHKLPFVFTIRCFPITILHLEISQHIWCSLDKQKLRTRSCKSERQLGGKGVKEAVGSDGHFWWRTVSSKSSGIRIRASFSQNHLVQCIWWWVKEFFLLFLQSPQKKIVVFGVGIWTTSYVLLLKGLDTFARSCNWNFLLLSKLALHSQSACTSG